MASNNAINLSAAGLAKYDGVSTFTGVTVTQHDVLIGAASNGITSVAPSATAGVPVVSAGAAADPVFGTAVVAGGGTGAVTLTGILTGNGTSAVTANAVTQHGILIGGASNAASSLGVATDGQLAIGSTGADPILASLTAGTNISIVPAAGSITINATGGGNLPWTVVTGTTQAAASNNGYIANNAGTVVITLPAVSAVGDVVAVTGMNNATGWSLAQNAGNQVFFGASSTTAGAGGSLSSTATRDSIYLVCITTSADWNVLNSIGNITVV